MAALLSLTGGNHRCKARISPTEYVHYTGAGWKNSILSLTRYYVWIQKFFKNQLNIIAYNNFIKDRLGLQNKIFTKKQLLDKIEPDWLILFEAFNVT